MDEAKARKILDGYILPDDSLNALSQVGRGLEFVLWYKENEQATLDGQFTADQLEAIAWWMRNHA